MECTIALSCDSILYTDYDSKKENGLKKLKLLGIQSPITTYKLDDVAWIVDKCERINILRATGMVDKYTFAFEEIFKRVKDKSKLYPQTSFDKKSWSIGQRVHADDMEAMILSWEPYELDRKLDKVKQWDTMVYTAWTELFGIDNKIEIWDGIVLDTERQIGRKINTDELLSGISSFEDYTTITYKGFNTIKYIEQGRKVRMMHLRIPNNAHEILYGLFKWSNYTISLMKYSKAEVALIVTSNISSKEIENFISANFGIRSSVREFSLQS